MLERSADSGVVKDGVSLFRAVDEFVLTGRVSSGESPVKVQKVDGL
jgi:hypothetical protein